MNKRSLFLLSIALGLMSCKEGNQQTADTQDQTPDQMTDTSKTKEWKTLFDGKDLNNWKAYNGEEITQWSIEDSAIAFIPAAGEREGSENLITKEDFTNFELSLEWKISEGGNSGIMWGVQESEEFSEPYYTGPEIQVLDNELHPDAKNGPIRQAGALYDLSEPIEDVTKPAGEWNAMTIRIDYRKNQGTVILNGKKINEFPLKGEEWENLVENSKFRDWEDFGRYQTGRIALQDHGDRVWYRNIKIREL